MNTLTVDQIARVRPQLAAGVERENAPDGGLRLLGPPHRRGPLRSILARLLRLPERVVVELDDIGRFVVDHMDGRKLSCLANAVAEHLKLTSREAETALTVFVRMLLKRRLVELEDLA